MIDRQLGLNAELMTNNKEIKINKQYTVIKHYDGNKKSNSKIYSVIRIRYEHDYVELSKSLKLSHCQ